MDKLATKTKSVSTGLPWTGGVLAACALGAALLFSQNLAFSSEAAKMVPAPVSDETAVATEHSETAVFAGGCFWGVQGVFQHVRGVSNVVSGYAGGSRDTAQYNRVSEGDTGHAESVQITYDPTQVTYGKLLQIFFSVAHDPTELNRQGPDTGSQYRSAVFPANDMQRKVAQAYVTQIDHAKVFSNALATKVEALRGFYPAESYHQNFLTRNPSYPYIVVNDLPKIDDLKRLFPDMYRTQPVLAKADSR
ncbi:peptide-methionine (S)-S-oxide reductase [Collimonas sp. PA-H2]|uniref:peptide-methionine (S)-S-oxide reductase MsrA n=1 Tax=Collimonas sp. PA-H2 TaxID=1881062 RepID=UPI000C00A3E1|nr:peptide-methionine (S)-S-oxide reductase MsrA [Collimonas sp. PA-H2]PFH07755.1 peptide-methionine (S)-S-oxide reductase [Collimonas sp. PA-H2]